MSGWIAIGLLALATFGVGAFLLRETRSLWTLLAAMLVLGLAGYAWQGSPGYDSVSAKSQEQQRGSPGLISARREFFDPSDPPSRFVITADAFAREGNYERSANILRGAVMENPNDGEAWLALGIVMVEHANGRDSPAAQMAFSQARMRLRGNPGPAFFEGVNAMRAGDLARTRELWINGLADASEDAAGREYLAERLLGLDRLVESLLQQQQSAAPPPQPGTAGPPAMGEGG